MAVRFLFPELSHEAVLHDGTGVLRYLLAVIIHPCMEIANGTASESNLRKVFWVMIIALVALCGVFEVIDSTDPQTHQGTPKPPRIAGLPFHLYPHEERVEAQIAMPFLQTGEYIYCSVGPAAAVVCEDDRRMSLHTMDVYYDYFEDARATRWKCKRNKASLTCTPVEQ
jgi:hypothetical protein